MNIRWLGLEMLCPLLFFNGPSLGRVAADAEGAPPKVQVSQPLVREITDYEDFTGRLEAVESVELRARVTGYIDKVNFKAGSAVKRGDVLFEIDPRPYKAVLAAADAEMTRAEAHLKLTVADLDRAKTVQKTGGLSLEDFNKIVAAQSEAEAVLNVAKAHREVARLNMEFTKVTAPINGKIGRVNLTAGNLVRADETVLATIVSTDRVYAAFNVDERTVLHLARLQRAAKDKDGKEMTFPVRMELGQEEGFPHQGKVDSTDVQVNTTSGTVRWRAVFPNPDGNFMPGMFVRVRLTTSAPYKALLVSDEAVRTDQGQKYLLVVNEKNVLQLRTVKLGALHDGLRVVTQGLKAGEWIVVGRSNGLKSGEVVTPEKTEMPGAPKEKPKPDK